MIDRFANERARDDKYYQRAGQNCKIRYDSTVHWPKVYPDKTVRVEYSGRGTLLSVSVCHIKK